MMPEHDPLINATTKPLTGNAKQREAEVTALEECRVVEHPSEAETLTRLEAVKKRKFAGLWNAACWILAVLALVWVILPLRPMLRFVKYWSDSSAFEHNQPPQPAGLSEKALLLLGDPSLDKLEQKRRLHLSDPKNPAYYMEYALAWVNERNELPPDYLKTVQDIAPDNAYFLYYAAAQIGGKSIEKIRSKDSPNKPRMMDGVRLPPLPHEAEYEIIDLATYDEALKLFARASALPTFETYTNEMIVERARLLPHRTMPEFYLSLMHIYGQANGLISLRKVTDVICARAEELSKNGSKEEFIQLAAQRDAMITGLARNPDVNLIGELISEVIARVTATNFHAAAERLGIKEMTTKYRTQADALQKQKDLLSIRSKKNDDQSLARSSSIAKMCLPAIGRLLASPPPITESEYEPLRMSEHEFVGGLGILTVAKLMLISSLAIFLFHSVMPRRIRIPAQIMARLPGAADWAWVLLLGVMLPILVFLMINRLTPLGGKSYGLTHFMFAFPGLHLVALWLALLIVPMAIMRRRLELRLAPLCFKRQKVWYSHTILTLLLVVSLTAYPLLVRFNLKPWVLGILALPVALATFQPIAHVWQSLLSKPSVRMFKTATGIAVLPAYAVAIILLSLTLPMYFAAERHWVAKDKLFRIDTNATDLGAYEFKVAAQMRRKRNAIMDFE